MPRNKLKTPKIDKKAETIAVRIEKQKQEFIIHLKKHPTIQAAAHQTGIGRSTVHRWLKEDEFFAELVDEAQKEGNSFICDMAESQIIKKIQEGDRASCMFWLKTHKKEEFMEYIRHEHELLRDDLPPEEQKLLAKSMIYGVAPLLRHKLSDEDIDDLIRIECEQIDKIEKEGLEHKEKVRKMLEDTERKQEE